MAKLPKIPTRDSGFMGTCPACKMPFCGLRSPDGAENPDGTPVRVACIPSPKAIERGKLGKPWDGVLPLHQQVCGTVLPPPADPSEEEEALSPPIPVRLPIRAAEQPAKPSGDAGNGGGLGGGSGLSLLVGKPAAPAPGNDGDKAKDPAGG